MLKKRYIIISVVGLITLFSGVKFYEFASKNRDITENYRRLKDPMCPDRSSLSRCQKINREGLDKMDVHASGMINFNDFLPNYKGDMSNVYVINLRPNLDLYYHKNRCLAWYGLDYNDCELKEHIKRRIKTRIKYDLIWLVYGYPPAHDLNLLQTEEKIVRELGAHYFTPMKNYKNWLSDLSFVDAIVTIFQNIPEEATVYIHCLHGKGRTTSVIVLYDIFRNYKKVSLKDIINRHYCLGSEDLFDTRLWPNGKWTQGALDARKNLAIYFYQYMKDPQGYLHQTWSQWCEGKNIDKGLIKIHHNDSIEEAR